MPFSTDDKQPPAIFTTASFLRKERQTARSGFQTIIIALALTLSASPVFAKSTGWQSRKDFDRITAKFMNDFRPPIRFSVRMKGNKPEFNAVFGDQAYFGYSFTIQESRAAAEAIIETHETADPNALPGMIEKYCLAKFAHAQGAGKDYWMIFMTDSKESGYPCIKLPAN